MTGNKEVDREIEYISNLPHNVCYECKAFYRPNPTGFMVTGDCIGSCRRASPDKHGWPTVNMSDWCCKYIPKEA